MKILPNDKPRVNLAELAFLREAVAGTPAECLNMAIQATVSYAKLHDGTCLLDEATYLKKQLAAEATQSKLKLA